jgi:hypothetical protein
MNQRWRLSIAAAIFLGVAAGELLCRWPAFRDLAGRSAKRGGLVSIVNGKGIYEMDLGDEVSASDMVLAEKLRRAAAGAKVEPARVEREVALLHAEFGDEHKFAAALRSAGLTDSLLPERIEEQLRGLNWMEQQIAGAPAITEQECRAFYDAHRDLFTQPERYRVSHLFLAAHDETPPDVAEEKEKAIGVLAARLSAGAPLGQLAAEASEDNASKSRGGDLGYISELRMPADFIAEIKKLRVGETSKPFRSQLGFHIARLIEIKSSRVLTFDEARNEIAAAIANEHRAASVARVAHEISAFASR